MHYTKYDIRCDLLFGITRYIYLLYNPYFTNKC